MPVLTIPAPAKVNIHLRVKNQRPDGFHEIESIFWALDFGDVLHFSPCAPDGELDIEILADPLVFEAGQVPAEVLPISQNIVFKAVSLYRQASGFNAGLKIRLEKRIPLGSGLGGGSSDAASALLAMNSLAKEAALPGIQPLDGDSLEKLGAELGSDVPFFLKKCGAAWVGGRGDKIKPLKAPSGLWIVLVKPDFPSNTAQAYHLLDKSRMGNGQLAMSNEESTVHCSLFTAHCSLPSAWPFFNDFLPVFLADSGTGNAYQCILGQLKEQGAEFSGLSGSGSACFGVFMEGGKAQEAYENLKSSWNFVKITILLDI